MKSGLPCSARMHLQHLQLFHLSQANACGGRFDLHFKKGESLNREEGERCAFPWRPPRPRPAFLFRSCSPHTLSLPPPPTSAHPPADSCWHVRAHARARAPTALSVKRVHLSALCVTLSKETCLKMCQRVLSAWTSPCGVIAA